MVSFKKYDMRFKYRINVSKNKMNLTLKELVFIFILQIIFCS
jgi:hypothetical protein